MRRSPWFACAVVAALLSAGPASARHYYGFIVGVAKAPAPPVVRAEQEPHTVLAGDAMVYVVNDPSLRFDGDLFRYGQYWFAYSRGYWYRGRSHAGPYTVIDVLKVPRAIIGVPRSMWKHHPLTVKAAPTRRRIAAGRATKSDDATARQPVRPARRRAGASRGAPAASGPAAPSIAAARE